MIDYEDYNIILLHIFSLLSMTGHDWGVDNVKEIVTQLRPDN